MLQTYNYNYQHLQNILMAPQSPFHSIRICILQVGSDLLPVGGPNLGIKAMYTVQQRVSDILDVMGEASAIAQELRQQRVINSEFQTKQTQI